MEMREWSNLNYYFIRSLNSFGYMIYPITKIQTNCALEDEYRMVRNKIILK